MSAGHPTSAASIGTQSPPGFSHVSTPEGCAFGCAATPAPGAPCFSQVGGTQPTPGTPIPGQHQSDEFGAKVKVSAAKMARLDLKGMMKVQNWLWLCSTALNTWGMQAVTIWQAAVAHAQGQHAHWCSLTPAQRALKSSGRHQGFHMNPPLVLAEAHIKSELLTGKILPDEVVEFIAVTKAGTLAEILEVLFQKYLPSAPTARHLKK
eukprot:6352151-Amphidinium_carterae.2